MPCQTIFFQETIVCYERTRTFINNVGGLAGRMFLKTNSPSSNLPLKKKFFLSFKLIELQKFFLNCFVRFFHFAEVLDDRYFCL